MASAASHYLVTGFPRFLTRRWVAQVSTQAPAARITILAQAKFLEDAKAAAQAIGPGRIDVLSGDVAAMHLGLSGEEYKRLTASVTHVFHSAAITYLGMPRDVMFRVNVDGTRNMLEFGRDCVALERFAHLSTAFVSGDRVGVIAEDELEAGQGFRNAHEETHFHAERLVQRAIGQLPITVFRPSSMVGDSRTGEIDRFDGPYFLGILLALSPLMLPLPLPGNGSAPLHVVPVDFVVSAMWALSQETGAVGRTFHIVDPQPLSARRAYELIAERMNRRTARFSFPTRAANMMLGLPGVERLARPQRTALQYANHLSFYTSRQGTELLARQGITCPPLAAYLDVLVSYVRANYRKKPEPDASADAPDPLDDLPDAPNTTQPVPDRPRFDANESH
ncbi:MAG: SDR family oxidoreductase [Myxococcaceae bacterium]